MGNVVGIYPTKFVTLNSNGAEGDISYGVRVADDYDNDYSNMFQKEQIVGQSPESIIELAKKISSKSCEIIDLCQELCEGIYIGDDYFIWSELKTDAGTLGNQPSV